MTGSLRKRWSSGLRRDMIFYSPCSFLQKGAKYLFPDCLPVEAQRYTLQASPLHHGCKNGACIETHPCRGRKERALIPHSRQCDMVFSLFQRCQRCILRHRLTTSSGHKTRGTSTPLLQSVF